MRPCYARQQYFYMTNGAEPLDSVRRKAEPCDEVGHVTRTSPQNDYGPLAENTSR